MPQIGLRFVLCSAAAEYPAEQCCRLGRLILDQPLLAGNQVEQLLALPPALAALTGA
jgi:hypothetical protein